MVLVKPCLKLEKEILAAAADDDENGLVAGYWPVGAAVVAMMCARPPTFSDEGDWPVSRWEDHWRLANEGRVSYTTTRLSTTY